MVCNRCKLVVKAELEKAGIAPLHIDLGEVELSSTPQKEQLDKLLIAFRGLGFELIDDRKTRIIEKIKSTIITLVHHSEAQSNRKLSTILSEALKQDYRYVSNLFSSVEGITIEK